MDYDYNEIVRQWFEELKQPFINYIRGNFVISYDDVMDIYSDAWWELREVIIGGRATDSKWKALIFKIGWRMAAKKAVRSPKRVSLDGAGDDGEDRFDPVVFEVEKVRQRDEAPDVYEDPDLKGVLGTVMSYIPDPCNKLLRLYYYEELSMTQIAEAMNYSTSRSAITTKKRCFERLKKRVEDAARMMGIID